MLPWLKKEIPKSPKTNQEYSKTYRIPQKSKTNRGVRYKILVQKSSMKPTTKE